jgi:hypothetical protein
LLLLLLLLALALLWAVEDDPADTTVTPDGRVTPDGMETPEGREMVTAEAVEKMAARMMAKLVFILAGSSWKGLTRERSAAEICSKDESECGLLLVNVGCVCVLCVQC